MPDPAPALSMTHRAMACEWELIAWGKEEAYLRSAIEMAWDELDRIESLLSTYRPTSEISQINARAAREPVSTTPEVFGLLERARSTSEATGGAFDITAGPLVDLWGFGRGDPVTPDQSAIEQAMGRVGWQKLRLDRSRRQVRFEVDGMRIDAGAFGKGCAVDSVLSVLGQCKLPGALISGGHSSIGTIGCAPDGEDWKVRIATPEMPEVACEIVELPAGTTLSTSGDLGQSVVRDGSRISHIIDPRTGHPADWSGLASVISSSAFYGDALSTAAFVLGPGGSDMVASQEAVDRLIFTPAS